MDRNRADVVCGEHTGRAVSNRGSSSTV
jgi:hypothetical protein